MSTAGSACARLWAAWPAVSVCVCGEGCWGGLILPQEGIQCPEREIWPGCDLGDGYSDTCCSLEQGFAGMYRAESMLEWNAKSVAKTGHDTEPSRHAAY